MQWAANGRWLDRTIIAGLLITSLALPAGFLARPSGPDDQRSVAVLFAPWISGTDAVEAVAAAGGRIVDQGRYAFFVLAKPESSDFSARVAERGAIMTLNARIFAGCFRRPA